MAAVVGEALIVADPSSSTLVHLTSHAVTLHRFDANTAAFSPSDSFSIAEAVGLQDALPVCCHAVIDADAGLQTLCSAFRAPDGNCVFGLLDLDARQFVSLARHAVQGALDFLLIDGPALCVMTSSALLVMRPGDDEDEDAPAASVTTLHLPSAATLLCALDDDDDDGSTTLLMLLTAGGQRSQLAACPTRATTSSVGSSSGAGGSSAILDATAALASRAPALVGLAPIIACASAHMAVDGASGSDHSHVRTLALRVWVGTTDGMVHCCGLGGEEQPLTSLRLPDAHICPLIAMPMPLQHGSDAMVIGVLAAAPTLAAPGKRRLLLLSALGEVQRSVDDVDACLCHDWLACGHPQILAQRAAFSADKAPTTSAAPSSSLPALCGYALLGLSATFADVPAANMPLAAAAAASIKAHEAAVARRRQLRGVATALSDRLSLGHAAVDRARREAAHRGLLTAHAHRLLQAEAACTSKRAARTFEAGGGGGGAGGSGAGDADGEQDDESIIDGAFLTRWATAVELAPVPLRAARAPAGGANARHQTSGRPPSAPTNPRVPPAPVPVRPPHAQAAGAPGVDQAGVRRARRASDAAAPRVMSLDHGLREGYWLLQVGLSHGAGGRTGGGGAGDHSPPALRSLSGALVHPSRRLHAHSSVVACLLPGARAMLTVAVPLSAMIAPELIDLDLLLVWRVACEPGRDATSGDATSGDAVRAPLTAAPPGVWRHVLGTRVRVDGRGLFERGLRTRSAAAPLLLLPASLTRTAALLVAAPPSGGAALLLELPQAIAGLLELRAPPMSGDAVARARLGTNLPMPPPGSTPAARLLDAPPHAAQRIVLRAPAVGGVGDGGCGFATSLEARLGATGRCAELILTAGGAAHEQMLTSAFATLQHGLPTGMRVKPCMASVGILDALRAASLAMHAEFAGAAAACEALRDAQHGAPAGRSAAGIAAAAFAREVGALQGATDARMSALHLLV